MARRALRPCSHCKRHLTRSRWCSACEPEQKRLHGFNDRRRGSRHARGYGSEWDRLRAQALERDAGLCQLCLEAGEINMHGPGNRHQVDHVVPRAEGGTDALENLQTICRAHHAQKTAQEAQRAAARKRGAGSIV